MGVRGVLAEGPEWILFVSGPLGGLDVETACDSPCWNTLVKSLSIRGSGFMFWNYFFGQFVLAGCGFPWKRDDVLPTCWFGWKYKRFIVGLSFAPVVNQIG